jgi:hypothetical protein
MLGGSPVICSPPATHVGNDLLLEVVVTCCLGETLNVVLLQDELETCPDQLRATTRRLLSDELTHARIGWAALAASAKRRSLADLNAPVTSSLSAALAHQGQPATMTSERRATLLDAALAEVILPGLARFGIVCLA